MGVKVKRKESLCKVFCYTQYSTGVGSDVECRIQEQMTSLRTLAFTGDRAKEYPTNDGERSSAK